MGCLLWRPSAKLNPESILFCAVDRPPGINAGTAHNESKSEATLNKYLHANRQSHGPEIYHVSMSTSFEGFLSVGSLPLLCETG